MKYLTAEELLKKYQEDAHDVLEDCAGKSVRDLFAIRVFNEAHDAIFGDRGKTKILDLGTASGTFVQQLSAGGYRELYGCDIDDYVKRNYRPLLKDFKTLDLSWQPLPWLDRSFDAVSAWCVLPHLENPFYAAREINRVLRPRGLFIFTAPHLTAKPSVDYFVRKKDFRSYRPTNNHIVLFTRGVIAKTILKYFDLIDIEYHARLAKIFRGPKGFVRKTCYRVAALHRPWQKALRHRWAYSAVYILRKKDAPPI